MYADTHPEPARGTGPQGSLNMEVFIALTALYPAEGRALYFPGQLLKFSGKIRVGDSGEGLESSG